MKSKSLIWFVAGVLLMLVLVQGVQAVEQYVYVNKWGSEGTGTSQFGSPGPFGIAYGGPSSHIYVTDNGNNRVEEFTQAGTFVRQWGFLGTGNGQFNVSMGIDVNSSGYVYVADYNNHRIQVFTSTGGFVRKWGIHGSGDGEFSYPYGIAVNRLNDHVYVTEAGNNRVQEFTADGTFVRKWGSFGGSDGQFYNPRGIAVDADDFVYVADTENDRIQVFNKTGAFVRKWGSLGNGKGEFNAPFDIEVYGWSDVYVADYTNARIQKFKTNGTYVTQWGTYGTGNGQFNNPLSIVLVGDNPYVSDQNYRIQEFSPSGNISVASSPFGAAIWVDNIDTGFVTQDGEWTTIANLTPGYHTFTFKLYGYYDYNFYGTVIAFDTLNYPRYSLKKLPPTVTSITPDNGENTGSVSITNLAGTYFESGAQVMLMPVNVNPVHKGSIVNGTGDALLTRPRDVFVSGDYAYVVGYLDNALEIINVSTPTAPTHAGSIKMGQGGATLDDPQAVYVLGNYAYVVSFNSNSLEIFDISNPAVPNLTGSIFDYQPNVNLLHPYDVQVIDYPAYSEKIAYVASYDDNMLEIVLVTDPANPTHLSNISVPFPNSLYVSGDYAYVTCNTTALCNFNIGSPGSPYWEGYILDGQGGALLDHPESVFVSGDYAYVASRSSNALEIINVTYRNAPKHVSAYSVTNPDSVSVLGNYAYVTNGAGTGSIEVVDVTNPAAPVHAGSIMDGGGVAPFLNQPSGLSLSGNYAYVTSWSGQSLEIVDTGMIPAPGMAYFSPTQITGAIDLTSKAAGPYNVIVTNPDGLFGTLANGFTVTAPSALIAAFSGTPTSTTISLPVTFTDLSSGTPTGWAWFFGDETYTGSWTQMTASAGWSARDSFTSVVMPNGTIVLIGGYDYNGFAIRSNETWQSTDNGTTWTNITGSPGWRGRAYHSSVLMPDGSIVLMGGETGPLYLNDTWRSTDNGATWTLMNASSGWLSRYSHTSVVLPDSSIVLMGGVAGYPNGRMNDTWLSTDYGDTWTQVNASSGWSPRFEHSSVALPDGSIVLMGGNSPGFTNETWRSTNKGVSWTKVNASSGWEGRREFSSVVMPDGSIVLMGGDVSSGVSNDMWRSTDKGTTWTQLPNAGWLPRVRHASVVLPDGSIVLMGGYTNYAPFRDVWRLTTASSSAQNPSHSYTTPGTYQVALQAFNTVGYSSKRETGYITVTSGGTPAPVADFTYDASHGWTVQFNDTSTGGPDSWSWTFGDMGIGNTSTLQNPAHSYTDNGTYAVTLTATNSGGSDSVTKSVTVVKITLLAAKDQTPPLTYPAEEKKYGSQNPIPPLTLTFRGDQQPVITQVAGILVGSHANRINGDGPTHLWIVEADGNRTYLGLQQSLPTNVVMEGEDPFSETNAVTSRSGPSVGGGLGPLGLYAACSGSDCTNNYALLIDGGVNVSQNHIRYWNDISFMYQTLNQTYGYPKSHITVLMSDGNNATADRHNATTVANVSLSDNSPLDIDSCGTNETIGNATKANLNTTLSTAYTGLTGADSLFIFTTGHGGQNLYPSGTNNSILYLWNNEYINDTEFVGKLNALPVGNISMVMEQCYSGGFVDNFTTNYGGSQKRVIATAANGSEPSYGNGFSNVWTRGVAMVTDDLRSVREADASPYGNGDGKINMSEAFKFANLTDPAATSSLANHEHPQYATKNEDSPKYLVSGACTSPNSITVTSPNGGETWYMGYSRNITWTQTGLTGNVRIDLYNVTSKTNSTLTSTATATSGSWPWTLPTSLNKSCTYRINITSGSATDSSDRPFSVQTTGAKGSMKVNTTPVQNAFIYLDGWNQTAINSAYKTNYTWPALSFVPGSHIVTVKLAAYLDQSMGIIVYPSQTASASFNLEPLGNNLISGIPNSPDDTGRMVITSTPGDSEVWIKAVSDAGSVAVLKGKTKYEQEFVPGTNWKDFPKQFMVTVKHSGYKDLTLPVNVARGLTTYADFELTQEPWLLTIGDFSSPVDMPPVVNSAKLGQTIPVKWHLSNVSGDVADANSFVGIQSYSVSCNEFVGDPLDAIPETSAGGSDLQYKGNGDWQYNWKTPKTYTGSNACRNMYILFYHGQKSPEANFKFK